MNRFFVCGDIHGSADKFDYLISQIDNPTEDDFLICAGDVGIEYGGNVYGNIKRAMKKFPGTIIVMRGNHDDRYWENHVISNIDYVERGWGIICFNDNDYLYQEKYPNIWYIKDEGGIYHLGYYNILFVPGAYSVDKYYRLRMGFPYNQREQLTEEEMSCLLYNTGNFISIGENIDFVISHTAPFKLQLYFKDLFLEGIDQSAVDNNMEKWLDELSKWYENSPHFKQCFFGHFHDDRIINDKYTMLYYNIVNLEDYE